MGRVSKQTNDTIKRADNACAVWDTYGMDLARDYQLTIQAEVPGTEVLLSQNPSPEEIKKTPFFTYMDQQQALLRSRLSLLQEREEKVYRELGEDKQVLDDRDRTVDFTRDGTFRYRNASQLFYGEGFVRLMGLDVSPSRDPFVLEQNLKSALGVLRELPKPPEPLNPNLPFWSIEEMEQQLLELIVPLEEILQEVRREKKETQEAQIERREALQKTRRSLVSFNADLETVARLLEQHEIADRIRLPGGRASSQNQSEDPPSPPPQNT